MSLPLLPRVLLSLFAALAVLALPSMAEPASASFDDTRGTVFAPAVDALAERDIISGCGDGSRFCVGDDVQRDQLASLLDRALDLPPAPPALFDDVHPANPHREAIDRVAAADVLVGCEDGSFCPGEPTTRGQVATVLDRAFHLEPTRSEFFVDSVGVHADAIDRVAANGVADGCTAAPTRYCPGSAVSRGQSAALLARTMDLVPRVEVRNLHQRQEEERQAQQITDRYPDKVWDDLAQCESGQNWSINTGNGYYGGLQFALSSWRAVGGTGYPHHASRTEQIIRGDKLQQKQGWGAWPSCSRQLGYR